MFTPYCFKQIVVKCDYVLQQVQTLSCCNSLCNKYSFLQLPAFTCYFHCSIISYHFIHSLLMTHFTSNYCYTLKIRCVCCIFASSYSLSHPFSFTIITRVGGSNGVDMGWDLWNIGYPSLATPTPLKSQKILFNKRALGWNLLPPRGD